MSNAMVGAEILFSPAVRTADTTTGPKNNPGFKGALFVLDVTAASGMGGLTFFIYDLSTVPITVGGVATGEIKSLCQISVTAAAVTSTGTYGYMLYPTGVIGALGGATGITKISPFPLPSQWGIVIAHGDDSNYTYALRAKYLR